MGRWKRWVIFAALILLFEPVRAQAALSPAEALNYERIGDLHFSPDGTKLAYIVLSYPRDWLPRVCVLDVASGAVHEITPEKKSERAPQWSPDGKYLAFLSNRNGKTQVYAVPAGGGDARALTQQSTSVSAFHWSPDSRAIAYLAQETEPADDAPEVVDGESELERLWVFDIATQKSRIVGMRGYRIDEFQWQGPDRLLVAATDKPAVEENTDAIYRLSIPDGRIVKIAQPPQPFGGLMISPDGKQFSVLSTRANGPDTRDLFVGTAGGSDLHDVSQAVDLAVVQVQWHERPTIWMSLADGFFTRLYKLTNGAQPHRIELPLSMGAFDVAKNGAIAYIGMDFSHRDEIYLRAPDGRVRQLTHIQNAAVARDLSPTTTFRTKSFDGTMIEAALVKPVATQGKLPLVLLVHGGPSSRFTAAYSWEQAWGQMLASHGYQVLMVNPRGSDGYSEDFLKANRGDWGGGDYRDVMAVLDAVIARGKTNPNRLGIGGWSYGGEMSAWAIGQTNRFKAAVFGAGVFDQAAEFETEHNPAGDEWYFGTPWDHPDVFARNSPSTFIRNARTPTLILVGKEDRSNPVGQSTGLYRALKHFGVETELVVYPGEGHSPKKWSYNIDMFQRILDWYDRHLKATH